jgi:hypothetical protein
VAWPPLKVLVASGVPPSWKITLPVGVFPPGATALTVAVRVTDCPNTDGLAEEATVLLLLAWLTTCVTVLEVLVLKLLSLL